MSDLPLVRTAQGLFHDLNPESYAQRETLLTQAAMLPVEPKTKEQHDRSFASSSEIEEFLKQLEKARVLGKEPALRECQRIDDAFRKFTEDLKQELNRLRIGEGNYQQIQQAKFKDAVLAQNKELDELDRKRHAALSAANTEEERDLISMDFHNQRQALESQIPKQVLAPGQKVKEQWEIEVTSYAALISVYPHCAYCKPNLVEIRKLLDSGVRVPGVKAERKAVSQSARGRKPKDLSVTGNTFEHDPDDIIP